MMDNTFHGRVGLQQRVLPSYRAVFLEKFASACEGGLGVFAGKPLPKEGITPVNDLQISRLVYTANRNFLDPSSSLYMCWQSDFISWLEDWQPAVLIVEANPRYPSSRKAISWMHQKGRKVIGWGLGAPALGGTLANLMRRERYTFLQSLDAIIAYSTQGAKQYEQNGILQEKIYVAFNAADPAPLIQMPLRTVLFGKKATLLFVGRLQQRKRVDLLLKACSGLPKELQPHVVVIGDGPAQQEFEMVASQIYQDTEFVGAKHGDDLERYYLKADIFVLPGTGGLAIQQAMSHGLPVIVAQGDGTQDDLVRKENGWQVPADDVQALTNMLRQALSDPTLLRRMGESSFRIVAEEINVEKMVEVFIRALNETCTRDK